jgi:hypothetical protein
MCLGQMPEMRRRVFLGEQYAECVSRFLDVAKAVASLMWYLKAWLLVFMIPGKFLPLFMARIHFLLVFLPQGGS